MCKKGEIYYLEFEEVSNRGSEQSGNRPVVILQNDVGNKHSTTTIVGLCTSQIKKHLPTHVYIGRVPLPTIVMLEQIKTIDKSRLGVKLGVVPDIDKLNTAIKISLGVTE